MSHSGPWNCNLFNHEFLNFSYRKPIESSHCKSKQIILKNHSWTAVINKYLTKQLSKNFSLRIIFTDLWCMIIKKWLPSMMDDTCSCTNHTWLVRALIIHTWVFLCTNHTCWFYSFMAAVRSRGWASTCVSGTTCACIVRRQRATFTAHSPGKSKNTAHE